MARADIRRLRRKVAVFTKRVETRVAQTMVRDGARRFEGEVRPRVPVDEGQLLQSIRARAGFLGRRSDEVGPAPPGAAAQAVVTGAPHAGHVEFGTSKMSARPFMRPAYDVAGDPIRQEMERRGVRMIEQAAT